MDLTKDRAQDQARAKLDSIIEMMRALETGEEIDGEDAHDRIQEDPLSVEVRSDWHSPGDGNDKPAVYEILLCTGGSAVKITGELNEYCEPETAQIEYQDWGTYWKRYTDTNSAEDEVLLDYAQQFYYGGGSRRFR